MRDRDSGIILGLIIGAIIALAILSKKAVQIQPTGGAAPSLVDCAGQQIQIPTTSSNLINIPRVDDILHTQEYDNRLTRIESQLDRTTLHLDNTLSKLLELNNTISKIQQIQPTQPIPTQPIQAQQILQPIYIPIYQPPQVIVQPLIKDEIKTIEYKQPAIDEFKPLEEKNVQNIQSENSQIEQKLIYKNNEKWDIKRGSDGRIKSLNIIRDVKKQ